MKYFTYGSNMSTDYVREHCPSAAFVMRADLPNHRIEFRRFSEDLKGGTGSIMPAPGEMVKGVIYEVDENEILALDVLEEVPRGIYRRDTYLVLGEYGEGHPADLYQVVKPSGPYPPSKVYLEFMLDGAKEHKIDPEYIARLESLRC